MKEVISLGRDTHVGELQPYVPGAPGYAVDLEEHSGVFQFSGELLAIALGKFVGRRLEVILHAPEHLFSPEPETPDDGIIFQIKLLPE